MIRWHLKRLSTGEILEDREYLPTDWGPIFGLEGFKDRISDLSWVGYNDLGWIEVTLPDPKPTRAEVAAEMTRRVSDIIKDTHEKVAIDIRMDKGVRQQWVEYRQKIREIPSQSGFPYDIYWPTQPEV